MVLVQVVPNKDGTCRVLATGPYVEQAIRLLGMQQRDVIRPQRRAVAEATAAAIREQVERLEDRERRR